MSGLAAGASSCRMANSMLSPPAERTSRDGARNNAVMEPIPAARSDTDTADLAAYYAAQLCP